MNTPLIAKSFAEMGTLNNFAKFKNCNAWANESFYFKSLNALCCSSFHSKDNIF
jgi:hypothetical protein